MSNPRITLDQWSALAAVVEAGGYAKAAERLHKSQSSVTYAVQQLQSQLGVKAFEIAGRKAVLTPTGDLLYRRARYLLDEAAALEEASKRLSAGWEAEIAIAVEVLFPNWLLLQCLAKLAAESPHTRIEVVETVIGHQTDLLSARRVDLAIFPLVPAGFVGESLMPMRFLRVASPEHPLHQLGRKLTQRDLRRTRHITTRESDVERKTPRTIEATERWTFSLLTSVIEAVRAGHGFALLPEHKIRDELAAGTLKPLAMAEGGERLADLYLIFADREHAGPATQRLAGIIRETTKAECERPAAARGRAQARHG
jgi:DNA-binding transcriptional LysR family regulator